MIMRLAAGERIDPDRISFVKVLKHVRRSVIRQSAQTSVQIKQVMAMLAAKVRRKLGNGVRRLREADRCLKRPASKYSFRKAGQVRRPTRRVAEAAHAPSRDSSVSQATALGYQAAVPAQDGAGGDEPVHPQLCWQEPDECGEDCAVGPVEPGPGIGAAQHGDLVPQHEQLGVFGGR
jgi:hypothetical protein